MLTRWVVGPTLGDANGGIMILSQEVCPWHIAFGFGRLGKYNKPYSINIISLITSIYLDWI